MNVYKLKMLYQLRNMFIYIIVIGIVTTWFIIYIDYIRGSIFAFLSAVLVTSVLFTWKVSIKSEELHIELIFNVFNFDMKWKEITKVECKKQALHLYNLYNRKMKISKMWKNYEQLWLKIYKEINKNNNECIFDKSFTNLIDCLKKENS